MKIIIVPEMCVNDVKKILLSESEIIFNTDILTLPQYFEKYHHIEIDSEYELHFKVYEKLKTLSHNNKFKPLINQYDFVKQVVRVHRYIMSHRLNMMNISDNHVRELFTHISSITTTEYHIAKIVEAIESFDVTIYEGNYSYYYQKIINKMLAKNAQLHSTIKQAKTKLVRAKTIVDELQYVAEQLLEKDLDSTQILYTDDSYVPYIENVLQRYQIPYYFKSSVNKNAIQKLWIKALQYYKNEIDIYTLFVEYNLLNLPTPTISALKKYYKFFATFDNIGHLENISYHELLTESFNVEQPHKVYHLGVSNKMLDSMKLLANNIKPIVEEINEKAQALLNKSLKDYVSEIYNLISSQAANAVQTQIKIKDCIEQVYQYLNDEYAIDCLIKWIEAIQTKSSSEQGVGIAKLGSTYYNKNHVYVVGCDNKRFNVNVAIDGIFNESMHPMWKNLVDNPATLERYKHQISNALKCFEDNRTYLFSKLDIDGKVQFVCGELLLPMEDYDVKTTQHYYERDYQLTPETSRKLFLKDGKFKASVSKIELFNKSPLEYYLLYGLNTQTDKDFEMNGLVLGQLYHYLLEKYTTLYGKKYAVEALKVVKQDIDYFFDIYSKIYLETYNEKIKYTKHKIIKTLTNTFQRLAQIEAENEFIPTVYEKSYHIELSGEVPIVVSGRIDRIDKNDNLLKVIDYKSGNAKVDLKKLSNGTQLQLPTYILATTQLYENHRIYSANYIVLKNKGDLVLDGYCFDEQLGMKDHYIKSRKKQPTFNELLKLTTQQYYDAVNEILAGKITYSVDTNYKQYYSLEKQFGIPKIKNEVDDE